MSYTSLIDSDVWPRIRRAIDEERERVMLGFLHAGDWETVRRLQEKIATLDWVLAEAKPPKRIYDDEDGC